MTSVESIRSRRPPRTARRAGYLVAIAVNVAILYVLHQLLAWDILPFLTADFDRVLPLITLSLLVTIAANVLYVMNDDPALRWLGEAVVAAFSVAATLRLYRMFPFDFTGAASWWEPLTRFVLVVTIVATGIAVVVNVVRSLRAMAAGS